MRYPVVVYALGLAALVACQTVPTPVKPMDGATLAQTLQASGLPVADVQVRTAETDPNKLLGRPNQYVGKISWHDQRATPYDSLTVAVAEVFANQADMDARYTEVDAMSKAAAFLAQYIYRNDAKRVIVYLPHDLTPEQTLGYKAWLESL